MGLIHGGAEFHEATVPPKTCCACNSFSVFSSVQFSTELQESCKSEGQGASFASIQF